MAKLKKVFCANCKSPIYRSNRRINENIKFGHKFYCSLKCKSQYQSKKQLLSCENCGKKFMRSIKSISSHNYCSRSCAIKVNNKKYPKRRAQLKVCANIDCNKRFKGRSKYCSKECKVKALRKYSHQQLIDFIKHTAQKLKRIPAKRELKEIADICAKSFGSWNKAIIAAGLQPNRSHDQRMYRRTNTVAIDGHLCDSVSEAIIDNWLTENGISHKKNVPYPKSNYRTDWLISVKRRKVFVEYFGLANDSPRYDRAIKRKKAFCRKQKLNLIAIYPQDIYPENRLNIRLKSLMES